MTPAKRCRNWDSTWRGDRRPPWFNRAVARWLRTIDDYDKGLGMKLEAFRVTCEHPWDHVGTVRRGGVEIVTTQPYLTPDEIPATLDQFRRFANATGMVVIHGGPGPWNEGTELFLFSPAQEM